MYGGVQQLIHKEARRLLLIDGEPTMEIDYSCQHPNLLDGMISGKAIDMESMGQHDYYAFDGANKTTPKGKMLRDRNKAAVNIAFNATNRKAAIGAITYNGLASNRNTSNQLLVKAEQANTSIASAFYSDAGVKLQAIDSNISASVQKKCRRKNVAVLNVHDSFIVKARCEQDLKEAMATAIAEETAKFEGFQL